MVSVQEEKEEELLTLSLILFPVIGNFFLSTLFLHGRKKWNLFRCWQGFFYSSSSRANIRYLIHLLVILVAKKKKLFSFSLLWMLPNFLWEIVCLGWERGKKNLSSSLAPSHPFLSPLIVGIAPPTTGDLVALFAHISWNESPIQIPSSSLLQTLVIVGKSLPCTVYRYSILFPPLALPKRFPQCGCQKREEWDKRGRDWRKGNKICSCNYLHLQRSLEKKVNSAVCQAFPPSFLLVCPPIKFDDRCNSRKKKFVS